jgi:hypothetical protein
MNPFAVYWLPDAEDALAQVWLQAPDPQAVTVASAQVDRLLARDPLGCGQHLQEGLYKLVVPPLAVFYSVDETEHKVEVHQLWWSP